VFRETKDPFKGYYDSSDHVTGRLPCTLAPLQAESCQGTSGGMTPLNDGGVITIARRDITVQVFSIEVCRHKTCSAST